MPYVYDHTKIQWPEDDLDYEPPAPKVEEFEYLSPPEFYGDAKIKPVTFDRNGIPTNEPSPAETTITATVKAMIKGFGAKQKSDPNYFGALLPSLRDCNVRSIYCCYDGGNDEGFTWVSHATLGDGRKIGIEELAGSIAASPEFTKETRLLFTTEDDSDSDVRVIEEVLHYTMGYEVWGTWLLGEGFGTGEYSMYGGYIVAIEAGTITDDRNAKPDKPNMNIEIDLGTK